MDVGAKNGVVGEFVAAAVLPRESVRDVRLGRAGARARWAADARSGWGALGRRDGPRGGAGS
jgi:hypothetical protein